jgi:hypothetical protein
LTGSITCSVSPSSTAPGIGVHAFAVSVNRAAPTSSNTNVAPGAIGPRGPETSKHARSPTLTLLCDPRTIGLCGVTFSQTIGVNPSNCTLT